MTARRLPRSALWADWTDPPGLVRLDPPPEPRGQIGPRRQPLLDAVVELLEQYRGLWPLTVRQVHYRLLPRGVVRDTRDGKLYVNDPNSYKVLSDVLTIARVHGVVPWEALHDPTRDWTDLFAHPDLPAFVADELALFLTHYHRLLLQTQPVHVDLIIEKTTAVGIVAAAVTDLILPVGRGGGQTSADMIHRAAERFRASGKDRAVVLIGGDLDKSGDDIPLNWARCLRDEHGLGDQLRAYKIAVTEAQVGEYALKGVPAKDGQERDGDDGATAYELEAFEPDVLQAVIRAGVESVLDLDLVEKERRKYRRELKRLEQLRADACRYLSRKLKLPR